MRKVAVSNAKKKILSCYIMIPKSLKIMLNMFVFKGRSLQPVALKLPETQ